MAYISSTVSQVQVTRKVVLVVADVSVSNTAQLPPQQSGGKPGDTNVISTVTPSIVAATS